MNSVRPSDDQLPRAGDVVAGKYRIESVVGTGGMGVVLGAQDISLGRRVAIKFLAPGKVKSSDGAARFMREARAAASIQSEHVVRVFEVGALPNGASYIVMEHLAGGDLGQILAARGALPIDEAVDYLLEACEAIGEAHKLGIVHRDLKPQNLFVTRTPDGASCVKVLDFGISKAIDEAAPNLTSTEAVMGTPLYMSPEQVRSLKNVDLRTDIWALGAILFELVTAAPIFEAPSATALYAMIAMDPPTSLRTKCPAAPPELEAVIQRCLHKDPNGRYADVAAFADALAPFASERGRVSAARVARVVRGGHGAAHEPAWPAAGGAAFATTGVAPIGSQSYIPPPASSGHGITGTGSYASNPPPPAYPSNLPPGANAAPGYTGYVQHANSAQQGSTPGLWQHQTGAVGPGTIQQRRSSSALGAILGVVAGLVLLAILAGGGVYFLSKRGSGEEAQAQADAAAAAAATAAPAVTTAAPATSIAATTGPTGAAKKGTSPAAPGAGAQKDAGAAPPTSAAPAAPAAPAAAAASAEAERIARLKQNAQGRCSAQAVIFKGNDPTAAKTVKTMTCTSASSFSPNSGSSNCERANCRRACTILNDSSCLFLLDNAERGNPLPF